ncbi:MAG: serine/threonine protein kinase [Proteobacteria bacterium]|nr:serine/threonine protein kinase [Pseudomonadota bacterium]
MVDGRAGPVVEGPAQPAFRGQGWPDRLGAFVAPEVHSSGQGRGCDVPKGGNVLSPGTCLRNRYTIGGVLARGGMSVLYHATDAHLPGAWVVKEMRPVTPSDDDRITILEQFRQEAAILATLSHPSLPRFIDSFEEAGKVYLVEELIVGRPLSEVAAAHRFTEDEAVRCGRELLETLEYLHQNEIVYRDLKPDNVMVADEGADGAAASRYRIIDFGIARLFSLGKQRDTVLMGTPGFASPEHYGNRQTDFRSDIYTLGAVLHHLVTGRDPGERPFAFTPPDELAPGISEWFSDIVMKALETDPSERFQTAREMRDALSTDRHLVLRAQTFRYPRRNRFFPRWERPLQMVSATTGSLGLLSLASSVDFLPLSMFLLIHPLLLLARYGSEWRMIDDTWFVSTPRELQLWVGDNMTRVPWARISEVRVHKFQRLFRPRRDIGQSIETDASIQVSVVEIFHGDGTQSGRRHATRFTHDLEGWRELLTIILSRAGLQRLTRATSEMADERYIRLVSDSSHPPHGSDLR